MLGAPDRAGDDNPAGAAGAPAVIAGDLDLVRPFVGSGVPTVVLLSERRRTLRHSRHIRSWRLLPDPWAAPSDALAALRKIAASAPKKPVLVYGDDAMLALLRAHRAELEGLYHFLAPAPSILDGCAGKSAFARLARQFGLTVPATEFGDDAAIRAFARRIGFPIVLKPDGHVGWLRSNAAGLDGRRGKMLLARDAEDLDRLLPALRAASPDLVAQEFIPGSEERIYSYHAYVGRDGDPLASFVGRKIRTNPSLGGESSYIEMSQDEEIRRLGESAVRTLGLVGPVKIDVKRDPAARRDLILEINLRFNLWHHLGAANGVNLPLTAYRHLTGGPLPHARRSTRVRWLDVQGDLAAFRRDYRPAGEWTILSYARSLLAPKVYRNFAWDDPAPALVFAVRALAGKLRRLARGGAGPRRVSAMPRRHFRE
jgi:predicted ATP-grasp superfamily ATP-dependent carboligase